LSAAGRTKALGRSDHRFIDVTVEELQAEENMSNINAFVGISLDPIA
jgi:hypothetical protein